jgi:LacI family transcriptional regulator
VAAVEQLLRSRRRFTAIFAANDQMAFGATLALHRRGLRVPDDISIVGFDDLPASRFTVPPLSTVRHPAEEIGRCAAQAMLALLRGERPDSDVPAPSVVVRESTASPRA